MLGARLSRLRLRLDALQERSAHPEGLKGWWLGLTAPSEVNLELPIVTALDRALERVGVHTVADARLLLELGVRKGRVGELSTGLKDRAQESLEEFEEALEAVEKMLHAGRTPPGARTALERGYLRLARVLRVAELFLSAPSKAPAPPQEEFELFARPGTAWNSRGPPPSRARMAVAEFLADRARVNVDDLVQKRRDLDMAHELLLRIGMEHDRDRGVALRHEVAQARERVRETPATRSLEALVQEVRHAAHEDPRLAWRSLRGLYERALEAEDAPLAAAAHAALKPLMPSRATLRSLVESSERDDLRRWFGEDAEEGPKGLREESHAASSDELLADLAFSLKPEQLSAFELAAGCARYFDVEDALSEEIVEDPGPKKRPVPRRVSYPTQNMTFERTGGLHDVHNFVLSDPRMLLYDLAAHRQLVRAYLEDEPPPQKKKMTRTAVRVYVCDASGSMHGARARFRDALIIAELNNLRVKARQDKTFDPLYFSFFNDAPTELSRVDTAREATRQIEKLFRHSPAEGQTDITLALMSAFDSIRAARGRDPYLARATVVLITDGEDRVDLELIRRTRAPMDALDIALSFISLGEENPDLKSLVQEQRSRGGRAFYHHLSDQEIQWARTEFDSPWRTLLPRDVPVTAEALAALSPHLEALEALAVGRAAAAAPVATEASFDALFPDPDSLSPQKGGDVPGPEILGRVADILDALVEAAALAPADRRATESVQLLQHLLGVYQLPPARYLAALASGGSEVHGRLARVRLLCRPFG